MRHVLLYTPQMRRHSGGGGGSRGAHEERQQTRAQQDQQGQQGAKRSHPGHDDGGLWDAVRRDAGWALAVRRERTRSQWAEWLSRGDGRVLEWPVLGMGVEMLHCRSWHHITWRCPVSSCGVTAECLHPATLQSNCRRCPHCPSVRLSLAVHSTEAGVDFASDLHDEKASRASDSHGPRVTAAPAGGGVGGVRPLLALLALLHRWMWLVLVRVDEVACHQSACRTRETTAVIAEGSEGYSEG